MKKKFFAAALGAAMVLSLTGAGAIGTVASAAEPVPIDMYLIAGQSNAAGYSTATGISGEFSNVMYGGEVNRTLAGDAAYSWLELNDFKDSVTVGYGRQSGYIGPEFGIAETINGNYSEDHKAFIFKSAAGGSSLNNRLDGESGTYGNWFPRSEGGRSEGTPTGVQYDNFVSNFEKVYTALKNSGYAPKVRGMFWMQGEADIAEPVLYKRLIKVLISDIREDLSAIAKDDLSAMPFIMGEVALTFGSLDNLPLTQAFVQMQRQVASEVDEVYTVDTSDLPIRGEQGNVIGTDQYHWSGEDMHTLGNRAGDKLYEAAFPKDPVRITKSGTGSGSVDYEIGETTVEFTLSSGEDSRLSKVLVGGKPVTDRVENGKLTVDLPEAGEKLRVTVEFTKLRTLTIGYEFDEAMVSVEGAESMLEEGLLSVAVTPKSGYEIVAVEFIGNAAFRADALHYNAETERYELTGNRADGTVRVSARKIGSGDEADGGNGGAAEEKRGCGSTVCAGAALLAVAAAAVAFKKRH